MICCDAQFKVHYVPPQQVSIDDSMVGMKNRIAYLQYMPNKRHSRFGIKKFCDATSGYVLHIELYAGKDFPIRSEHGQAHSVVMDLMRKCHLLSKGYHLFTDNFYTKPLLARILDTEGTLLTGTVRSNSKGLPAIPAKLNVGQMVQFRDGNSLVVAFREKKSQRKPVLMLSTSEVVAKIAKCLKVVAKIAKYLKVVAKIAKCLKAVAKIAKYLKVVAKIAKCLKEVAKIAKYLKEVAKIAKCLKEVAKIAKCLKEAGLDIDRWPDRFFHLLWPVGPVALGSPLARKGQ